MDINITFCKGNKEWCVCAKPNQTILEVVREYDIPLSCECEGSLACSTCHVIVRDREGMSEDIIIEDTVLIIEAKEDANGDMIEDVVSLIEKREDPDKGKKMYKKTTKVVPISDEENDLLDLATGLSPTSRLGCQVKITEELEGAIFEIPCENRNSPPVSTKEKEKANS